MGHLNVSFDDLHLCPFCGERFESKRKLMEHIPWTDPVDCKNAGGFASQGNKTVGAFVDLGKQVLNDPLGLKETREIMEASIQSAKDSIDPAGIENEMHRQHEHYGTLLMQTEDEIAALEGQLEFKRAVRDRLVGAREGIASFLWPEQKVSISLDAGMEIRHG